MTAFVHIEVSEHLYLRDPQETALGKKIIEDSIYLIDDIGFEQFTFKKLAAQIESTEASVYRYFESKYQLLLYLESWYWHWIIYRLDFHAARVSDPKKRLDIILKLLTDSSVDDPASTYVNEAILYKVVIANATKTYLTSANKGAGRKNLFEGYYDLCRRLGELLKEIKPGLKNPRATAASMVVLAHRHLFYGEYLPSLTEIKTTKKNKKEVVDFLKSVFAPLLT